MLDALFHWDHNVLLWVQENLRNDFLNPIMKFFTYLGNEGLIAILMTLALLIIPKMRKTGILCACSLIADAILVNVIIKNVVARVRPYELFDDITNLVGQQSDMSFPSGHAASCFAVAVVLLICAKKRISLPFLGVSLIISFSRIYVGVHYPSDVIAGIAAGTLVACVTCLVAWKLQSRKKISVSRQPAKRTNTSTSARPSINTKKKSSAKGSKSNTKRSKSKGKKKR